MPRISHDQLDARRRQILIGARTCFAKHGYEAATVRRLEMEIGLSRGAIFHHFKDKETLFLAVADDDAATMATTVAAHGLVQVMRDLLANASEPDVTGWLGSQLEVTRRLRTDANFAARWSARSETIDAATRERLARQAAAGTLRSDVPLDVLTQFLELAFEGLISSLAMGRPTDRLSDVLDLVERAVRRAE